MHVDRSEKIFIISSVILLVVFALAVGISGFAYGIQVPAPELRVDPRTVATPGASPFGDPVEERLRELAPGKYEVYILAQTWAYQPNQIRIPVGSTVTFYVTSKDVQHGFKVDGTNINMMIIPGQVSRLTATFNKPGTYNFICHEYCGVGHHTMFGQIIVEQ
ncbi:MAG: cytochrome c oxidase subunit II [Anaerolineae bacterium]